MKKIIIILLLLVPAIVSDAQYAQFSQYYASPLNLAPSFAGTTAHSRLAMNYRDQWAKIPGVFRTYSLAGDMHVERIHSGFGILIVKDVAGQGNLGRIDFGAIYSWYGIINKTSQLYFRPGVEFKMSQRNLDFNKLIFGNQLTPYGPPKPQTQPPPQDVKKTYMDARASMLIYNPEFWAGVTVDHLFHPADAYYDPNYRSPYKYGFYGGYRFKLGARGRGRHYSSNAIQDWFLVSGYLRMQQYQMQIDIGGYWNHDPLTFGIWARGLPYVNLTKTPNIDAFIFLVGLKIYSFEVGYSYDMTVSPLIGSTGGSHEITLIYKFDPNFKSRRRDGPIPCPSF